MQQLKEQTQLRVRSVNQSCWLLSPFLSPVITKRWFTPKQMFTTFVLFPALSKVMNEMQSLSRGAHNCQCLRTAVVLSELSWKNVKKAAAEPQGSFGLFAGCPVLSEHLSCPSSPCRPHPSPGLSEVCMATCAHRPLGHPERQRAIAMVIRAQILRKAAHCDWCAVRWEEQNVTATGSFFFFLFSFCCFCL